MADETYNGWTNYETWLVQLWLSNEEALYNQAREVAKAQENARAAGSALWDWLAQPVDLGGIIPDEISGFAYDLVFGAFGRVNWPEVADSLRDV